MHHEKLTGLRLFTLWVFGPCARLRLCDKPFSSNGKICRADFDWIKSLLDIPEGKWLDDYYPKLLNLLEICFPNVFKSYTSFTNTKEGKKVGIPWSISSVKEFWYHHHKHPDLPNKKTDVYLAFAHCFIDEAVIVLIDGLQLPVENFYKFPIRVGDMLRIHNNVIVEVFKDST
ncbi:MAG: hypothetical protein WC666_01350 [Candidatus Paceibacterota bacterium]|jgi:hypothetical protein